MARTVVTKKIRGQQYLQAQFDDFCFVWKYGPHAMAPGMYRDKAHMALIKIAKAEYIDAFEHGRTDVIDTTPGAKAWFMKQSWYKTGTTAANTKATTEDRKKLAGMLAPKWMKSGASAAKTVAGVLKSGNAGTSSNSVKVLQKIADTLDTKLDDITKDKTDDEILELLKVIAKHTDPKEQERALKEKHEEQRANKDEQWGKDHGRIGGLLMNAKKGINEYSKVSPTMLMGSALFQTAKAIGGSKIGQSVKNFVGNELEFKRNERANAAISSVPLADAMNSVLPSLRGPRGPDIDLSAGGSTKLNFALNDPIRALRARDAKGRFIKQNSIVPSLKPSGDADWDNAAKEDAEFFDKQAANDPTMRVAANAPKRAPDGIEIVRFDKTSLDDLKDMWTTMMDKQAEREEAAAEDGLEKQIEASRANRESNKASDTGKKTFIEKAKDAVAEKGGGLIDKITDIAGMATKIPGMLAAAGPAAALAGSAAAVGAAGYAGYKAGGWINDNLLTNEKGESRLFNPTPEPVKVGVKGRTLEDFNKDLAEAGQAPISAEKFAAIQARQNGAKVEPLTKDTKMGQAAANVDQSKASGDKIDEQKEAQKTATIASTIAQASGGSKTTVINQGGKQNNNNTNKDIPSHNDCTSFQRFIDSRLVFLS